MAPCVVRVSVTMKENAQWGCTVMMLCEGRQLRLRSQTTGVQCPGWWPRPVTDHFCGPSSFSKELPLPPHSTGRAAVGASKPK